MNESPVYSVTQVNQYIKGLLDQDQTMTALYVRGEVSNYKAYPSGHHYFSLKDAGGAIRCVMFRREAVSLRFRPENGMKVLAFGRVTVFPRDGQYQLYCSALTPDGVGDLHVAFEQLKQKLYEEGLFEAAHKKPLPRFPEKIALITSPAGAAVRDMLRILEARWPLAEVCIIPVRVQGAEAPGEIAGAIAWANQHRAADLLITGRGGGSMEDLWAFNEEIVARAIYASDIPIISAVGHEPDVTIADFAADLRAATPSNAAELAVPDQNEIYAGLWGLGDRLGQAMTRQLEAGRAALERARRCRVLQEPMGYVDDKRVLLDYQRERFARGAAALDALSPLKVLGRGYGIPRRTDGGVIRSVKEVDTGDGLELRLSDGSLTCTVLDKRTDRRSKSRA